MASSSFAFTSLLVFLLLLPQAFSSSAAASGENDISVSAAASSPPFVPSASFLSTLQSTLKQIKRVASLISSIPRVFGDRRFSAGITDCLELLDLSSDELSWTLSSSTSSPASVSFGGTGDRLFDLRSWMSAALGNQDTCKEGLSDRFQTIVDGLDTVTSLISKALKEVARAAGGTGSRRLMGFPEWVSPADRRLLQASSPPKSPDVVVAQDGTGNYDTVSAAVEAAPDRSAQRYVIYVKKGVYKENVEINKKKWNLMIIGDGVGQTIISGGRSYVGGWTTFRSATFAVASTGFIARDLTIENTAGPENHQAVAIRTDSDLSVYYRCEFTGYQDTVYAHSLRQFFRDCRISGTIDFVFGDAAAVFQNCTLSARRPLPQQKNAFTAQGRRDPNQNTGFSFQFCNVTGEADLTDATPTYLGRPWKEYSRVVFMQSYLGPIIRPEGWLEWDGDFALDTLYYAEYMNNGPGSVLDGRVKWAGYHVLTSPTIAVNFTVAQFIDGDVWLPATGVEYTSGLSA